MLRRIKKLFAVVLSLAIIAMSLFTGVVVSAETGTDANQIVSEFTAEENELSLLDPTQPNSQSNPYIIASANQMYCFMIGNSTNGGEKIDTAGKYFKVADGMKSFYMNGGATVAAMTTPEQVKEYFTVTNTSAKKVWSDKTKAFKGTFDGNGVTIYGIRSDDANAGLFPFVDGDATIKNVTVKNSYLVGATGGGLVGTVNGSAAPNSITAENCQVINNYISGSRGDCGAGGLFGFLYSGNATDGYPEIHVNNCIVAGNELVAVNASAPGAFSFAGSFGGNRQHKISNSIFLGGDSIFNTASWWAKQPNFYENVYTDADLSAANQTYAENQLVQVTTTTGAGVKEAMPNLDWYKTWVANAGIPVLRAFHNIVTVDNGDGTHSESCADCDLVCATLEHGYSEGKCTCGAIEPIPDTSVSEFTGEEMEVSLLDPTQPNSESNPYIIENANQMYCLMLAKSTNGGELIDTAGKFFKVADGMKAFYMNGGATVAAMTTPEQVKEYFTVTNTGYKKVWTGGNKFKGTFDGNGVTVYGIGSDGGDAGLFPEISGNVTVKNVTVKNSYLVGANAAGGIVGDGNNGLLETVTIENCAVINNYISAGRGDSGAGGLAGFLYNSQLGNAAPLTINNCLVAGNEIVSTKGQQCTAIGGSFNANDNSFSNSIFLGYVPFLTGSWHTKKTEAYNNCYTDQDVSPAGMAYTDAQLVQVTTTTGEGVKTAMPNLDWNKVFAANDGIPELRVFHNIVDGVCERCELKVYEDPCAKGHTLVSVAEVPATKTTEGVKAHEKCSVCNGLFIGDEQVNAEDLVIPMIVNYDIWDASTSATGLLYDDQFITNNEGDGTQENPYIISTAEQLASVTVARIKDANGATVDTAGLYFKVADHIDAFYMNGGKEIANLKSAAEVKAYFEATPGAAWWVDGNFKGNFDGNGATVYGLYATKENAGLFQNLGAGSVIKNIAVKNSYFSASSGNAGAIAGQVQWYNGIGDGTHTFENCISQNNYFAATGSAGAIIGHGRENQLIINNCLAADNEFAGEAYLIGNSWNNNNSISNTIVIGGLVYGNNNSLKKAEIYSNVYTNTDQSGSGVDFEASQVTVLTEETMTMDNMSGLDWDNDWAYVGSPELRVFHNFVATDNGDGTHSEKCECGLTTAAQEHIFVNGECVVCENKCLHSNVGEAQTENFVDATCVSAGSYDTVTYCTDCGCEISRETTTIEINPDAHAFDSDADKDCNNGCGLVRVCYGDSDGDGEINNKDIAAIMQHINGWDTEIDEAAADVNRDGKINNKDYALLMQYVNGWEVSIG